MNSLEQLNNYSLNNGVAFTDDRPYAIAFNGTTTAESIATNEDTPFLLDPINDFIFSTMRSVDNATSNHVTLEIDLSNSEDMSTLTNRYEITFPAARRNIEYKKYERHTDGSVSDYQDITATNNRANVWVARYIQTNRDFKNLFNNIYVELIDRTSPIAIVARLRFPPTGTIPVGITNNSVAIDNNTSTINADSFEFATAIDASNPGRTLVTDRPLLPATGDFTVEMYLYGAVFGGVVQHVFGQGGANGTRLRINTDRTLTFFVSNTEGVSSTATIANDTWTHVALVNQNNILKMYINGVLQNTITKTNSVNQSTNTVFGALSTTDLDNYVGLMEEIRVSAVARYTANFTPQTAPHTPDINTLLLLHPSQDNVIAYRSWFDSDYPLTTIEKTYNVTLTGSDEISNINLTRSYTYGATQFLFTYDYPEIVDDAIDQRYSVALGTTFGGILQVYGQVGSVVQLLDATRAEVNQFYRDVQYVSPGTEPLGDTITWNVRNVTDGPDDYTSASGSFQLTA